MTHYGFDISNYQGELGPAEIAALKAAGAEFVYVLATQGDSFQNPDAPQQTAALRAAGIRVGLYHFVTMDDLLGQLDNLQKFAAALGGTRLPIALDCETPDPAGWQALAVMIAHMALNVENWSTTSPIPHPRSIIYVNLAFYRSLPDFPWGRWVWLADPNPGAPHEPCLILQRAPVPLVFPAQVDPDVFCGSESAWALFTGESFPPPAPAPQEADMALSQAVTFRPGQYDLFQVSPAGVLYHKYYQTGAHEWQNEDVAQKAGVNPVPVFAGEPSVSVVGGVCVVAVEDKAGNAWVAQQGASGGWDLVKLP